MKYSFTTAALASFVLASPVLADDCAETCNAKHFVCLGSPGANRAACASNYAMCLGYNPYLHEPFVTPTACSRKPTATSMDTSPTVEACSKSCSDKYNACRGSPKANRAVCASEYANCLGYNPFGPDGSLATPTACSKDPGPTGTWVPGEDCGKMCWNKFNACRGVPGANLSTCVSSYHACLGHDNGGKYDKPAECYSGEQSSKPAPGPGPTPAASPAPAPAPAPDACAKDCWDKFNACRKPGGDMSKCASDYSACIGYNPFTDGHKLDRPLPCRKTDGGQQTQKVSPPVVTGSGDRVQPAAALLALAAAALL